MTEIDELQAGPELDALIAERVMGWVKVEWDGVYYWRDPAIDDSHTGRVADSRSSVGDLLEDLKPWSPSTDIAAAWEVVEKLCESAFDDREIFSLEATFEENGEAWEKVWDCVVGSSDAHKDGWGFGHMPEIAICLAALRAFRVAEV